MTADLDKALLDAHARKDGNALIELYHQAAIQAKSDTATGFFLTHAYVFALECGDPRADQLRVRLIDMGRETPV
jgi:hypothetical protein